MARNSLSALLLPLFLAPGPAFSASTAAPGSPGLLPLIGLIKALPPLKQELLSQIDLLPAPAAPAPASLELQASPASSEEPKAAAKSATLRLLHGLLAHPAVIAAHRAPLSGVFGPDKVQVLEDVAQSPPVELGPRLQSIREELDLSRQESIYELRERVSRIYDAAGWREPSREALAIHLKAAESGSTYAFMNLGRRHELASDDSPDPVKAYQWYALAALGREPSALARLVSLERGMLPAQVSEARKLAVDAAVGKGLLKTAADRFDLPAEASSFIASLGEWAKPKIYLAGPWGFMDFNHKKAAYGTYVDRVKDLPFRQGFEMLKLIGEDIRKLGWATLNPWTDTLPELLIAGVMFGAGADSSGAPWREGGLAAGTMPKERLLHWLSVLGSDYRVDPKEYSYSESSPREHLEEVYRTMVGDVIYRGNRRHVESADVVFVNLNAYRGDADDGSLFEFFQAVESGKEVLVLVDREPETSLGESIFGKENRWNMMVSGYVKEHRDRVRVFHAIDDVLAYLKSRIASAG